MTAFAGRFAITGLLGSGATASVYSARDARTEATVAVKVLHPHLSRTGTERDAFFAEAAAAGRIAHPGVPAVLGHGIDDDGGEPRAWIATSLAPGRTLARLVDADGPLEPGAALSLTARLLDALAAVHAAGLVHRDVAPGNVVVADDGAVSLLDFGLADAPGRPATGADVLRSGGGRTPDDGVIGSVNYLSPEQALGAAVDERGDLYQVAGLLHFALTGRPPFPRATTAQIMAAHVSAPPPVPSALDSRIPAAVDELVVRGLTKDPAARPASATAMAADVRALLGEADPAPGGAVWASGSAAGAVAVPSVFVGSEGVLVDRDAATAVLPRGRGGGGGPADVGSAGAPRSREQRGNRTAAGAASPAAVTAPSLVTGAGISMAKASVTPTRAATTTPTRAATTPTPTTTTPARTSRTALAVTAGAVAVAATIWLVAANAAPTAPPPAVAVASAPPPAPTVAATTAPTVAPTPAAPQAALIPDLAGLSRADAVARLAAAGLTVGAVSTRDGTAVPGSVLESDPAAGSSAAPGAAVALVVASGRNAVPDVHGRTPLAAGATLTAAGFAVTERAVVDSTVPESTVLGTEPGEGTVIALGEPVTVVVTRLPARPTPTPTPTPTATATPSPTRPPAP